MTEHAPAKGGRPLKNAEEGRRPTVTFRCRPSLQKRLQEAALEGGRSVSEEIERRLDETFTGAGVAEAAANAVDAAAGRLAEAERVAIEVIFSTLEEFETLVGGKDACSFAAHVGQSLALHVHRDAQSAPDAGPWWEDEERQTAIRAKVLKSAAGLLDNWDFVQKSSMIPSVGWVIDRRIKEKVSVGYYARISADAESWQEER